MRILTIRENGQLAEIARNEEVLSWAGVDPFLEGADCHLVACNDQQIVEGCCSLWWRATPMLSGKRIGAVGHFFASNAEAGRQLLGEATSRLGEEGVDLVVGPMNGNTWRKYRLVTESDGSVPIFLEPTNPEWWPSVWRESGFESLAEYHSSVIEDLSLVDPRFERTMRRLQENEVVVRPIRLERFEEELRLIYQVSVESFVSNFLYTPLPEAAFVGMYLPLKAYVDPSFALIAMQGDQPVGFVFSIPDLNRMRQSERQDTLIIKTLAVLPGREWAGLGTVLVERMRIAAAEAGYARVIHALMHDQNNSANIARNSRVFRRYALFSRSI